MGTINKFYKRQVEESPKRNNVNISRIVKGITTTGEVSSSGYGVTTTQDSYIYSSAGSNNYNFFTPENDFGISLWVKLPPSQSYTDSSTNSLIKKEIKKETHITTYQEHLN